MNISAGKEKVGLLSVFFGVVLPIVTLLFEIFCGLCASVSFDPIPTVWHILLVALVPVANISAIVALRSGDFRHARLLLWMNGVAAGVSLCYAVAFLPFTPFAVMALAFCGAGLIPLTPLISMIATLVLRRKLCKQMSAADTSAGPGFGVCFSVALAALLLLELPEIIVYIGAKMALKQSTQVDGLQMLRTYGDSGHLLRLCYRMDRPLSPRVLLDGALSYLNMPRLREITPEQGQMLYYRVTGTPYNAVEPPDMRGVLGKSVGSLRDNNEFDFSQGGDAVAAPLRGLSLEQSRIQGSIDAESGTSYTEWTLVFRNDSDVQREARAQVTLPPGGVVSRLTLWINDQEREAAYSGKSKVQEAYRKIVQKRRDPVLVTTSGRDLVLVQCFPVPPNGGIMRTRIGITAPLALESLTGGVVRLPYFVERNFDIRDQVICPVSIQADSPLVPVLNNNSMYCSSASNGLYNLQGSLGKSGITAPFSFRLNCPQVSLTKLAKDTVARDNAIVRQVIVEEPVSAPSNVIIVIDGSRRMAEHRERLARFIRNLPDHLKCSVIIAGDEAEELCPLQGLTGKLREYIAERIKAASFEGGCDNVPALKRAVEMLDGGSAGAVIWLNTTQPVEFSTNEEMFKSISCGKKAVSFYQLQFDSGPNVAARKMEEVTNAVLIPNFGNLDRALLRVSEIISGDAKSFRFKRWRESAGVEACTGKGDVSQLVRLWAYDEILKLAASGHEPDLSSAVKLAQAYHLVTPVSGAVVLETEEQYREAGLTPVEANLGCAVVAVPEPETWALLLIGIIVTLLGCSRRRRYA